MRVWSVDARYASVLEADVSRAVEQIRLDAYRREHGHEPIHPDFAIDATRTGDVFVVVGNVNDSLPAAVVRAVEQTRSQKKRTA